MTITETQTGRQPRAAEIRPCRRCGVMRTVSTSNLAALCRDCRVALTPTELKEWTS